MNKKLIIAMVAATLSIFYSVNFVFAASLSVASVSIPSSVNQGDTFTLSASISGSDATSVSATLDLPSGISCTPTASQSVSLDSQGSGTASWSCTGNAAGDYTNRITVSVSGTDSSSGSLSDSEQTGLKVLSPASLTASSTSKSGGSVIFTVGVNNAGDLDTTYTVGVSCSTGATCSNVPSGSQSISGNAVKSHDIKLVGTAGTTYTATATITGANGQVLTTSQALTEPTVTTAATTTPVATGSNQTTPGVKITLQKGKANITIPSIAAAKSAVVVINKTEDLAFRQISIFVKNSVNNIQVTVTKLADKPASVTQEVTGKVYHYVQVDKNVSDADVNQSAIRFEVEKSWLAANNVNKSAVALYRYESNAWSKLQTTMMSEDDTNVLYESISPGLSVFAISGELVGAAPAEQPTTEEPSTEAEGAPLIPTKGKGLVVAIIIVIIIGAGVVFYLVKKNVIKLGGAIPQKKSSWDDLRKKYNRRV